jgi:uncharacterized protein HemX
MEKTLRESDKTSEQKKKNRVTRSLIVGAAVLAGMVIYAWIQVTKVNLDETRSTRRQEQAG